MANEKNLKNGQSTQFRSGEEAVENGKKGGIASGKSRRRKKTMKAVGNALLQMAVENPSMRLFMEKQGIAEDDMDNITMMMASMIVRAQQGNVRAAEFIRDTIGESPAEKMHAKDNRLKREEFEYQKERDAGATNEIEDLDELEADIYGGKDNQPESEEKEDDSV